MPVDAEPAPSARLVGRDGELSVLRDALSRALDEREPRLVTLVGVPGIGKSRLVHELHTIVESVGQPVAWLRGRSLPYGEGVSFWAFGRIVKAQAGILETDSEDTVETKLASAVAAVLADEREADWVRRHLGPVVGLRGGQEGDDRRAERFAAWRRYLEALAGTQPLVLVFEDLHWADDGLLDFFASLGEWLTDLPILVIGTARPDVLERRPAWAAVDRMTLLTLEPLSDAMISELIDDLLPSSDGSADRSALLVQAGGNPLYAEQYVRMLADQGEAHKVPETVQALIVARLDALPEAEKRVAQAASVTGGVFWSGAVAAASGEDRWTVEEHLQALERKVLVRRSREASVANESEWVFAHALVRDAAYAAIPRATRAEKHLHVAAWIESLGRPEDHAELLAHHYLAALDLASAAGLEVAELPERALAAVRQAGDRALALHAFAGRCRLLPARASISQDRMIRLGRGYCSSSDERCGSPRPEVRKSSLPRVRLSARRTIAREPPRPRSCSSTATGAVVSATKAAAHLEIASALVGELEPSPAKAAALCFLARTRSRASEHAETARIAGDALALAESLGLDEVRASALWILGAAKLELGEDESGLAELEESIEVARSIGSPEAIRANATLAHQLRHRGQFTRSVVFFEEALRLSERYGSTPQRRMLAGMLAQQRFRQGRWDEAVEAANAFLEEVHGVHYHAWHALQTRGLIRLSRGDEAGIDDAVASIEAARSSVDASVLCAALGIYGRMLVLVGRMDEARQALDESLALFETLEGRSGFDLPYLVITAFELGEDGERVLGPRRHRAWAEAAKSYFAGDFARAADRYEEIGSLSDEAEARLRAAKSLMASGNVAEGEIQLERALGFYRSVGATRFIREGEALLAAASSSPRGSRGGPARARSPRRAP